MIYDTVIIGGGAAGCSAAITLAELGARVALFEAKSYPHDKLCGEFLSPETCGIFAQMKLEREIERAGVVPIDKVFISAAGGRSWQERLPGRAMGLSRRTLDSLLAKRAEELGTAVHAGWQVNAVRGNFAEGFEISAQANGRVEKFSARSVVGAWGKRARLDYDLKRRFATRSQPFMAIKAHFEGLHLPGRIELHGFRGGYCGMSKIENGKGNVCLLVRTETFREAGKHYPNLNPVEGFIAWMQKQNERLEARLNNARRISPRWISISQIAFSPKPAVEAGILMVGDSAGLIAPLAGDGIAMAMESGMLAGNILTEFLCGRLSPQKAENFYREAWERKFLVRLRLGMILQPFMLQPRLLSIFLSALTASPALGQSLIRNLRSPIP